MTDGELSQVRDALASAKPSLKPAVIAAHVQESLKSSIPDLTEIVQTLGSMNSSRINADISVEEFANNIAKWVTRRRDVPKDYNQAAFEQRLVSLLSIESLVLSAKSFDIEHEYDRIFNSARIISDIRPVFGLSAVEPIAAMVVHNLKIRYYENGELKVSFFALDSADLAELRKVVDRAEGKTTKLEKMIAKSGVHYLESK